MTVRLFSFPGLGAVSDTSDAPLAKGPLVHALHRGAWVAHARLHELPSVGGALEALADLTLPASSLTRCLWPP